LSDGRGPHLSELQALIARAVRSPRTLVSDPYWIDVAERCFTRGPDLTPVERLEIYREQFWLRHTACLLEDYGALSALLGQARWERLAEEYLQQTPLSSFSLRELGAGLPAFVADLEWLPERGPCADLARLEWAYVEVFDAADVPPIDPERLQRLTPEQWQLARLRLDPALVLLELGHPVAELRRSLRSGGAPSGLPAPAAEVVVVHRGADANVSDERLPKAAARMLIELRAGATIVEAALAALPGDPSQRPAFLEGLPDLFRSFAERGYVVDVVVDERPPPADQSRSNG